jgi:sulfofructosephosphate aldolase
MSLTQIAPTVRALQRPSGAFAMLAVDQREAMRAMFAAHQSAPVTDKQVADFKLAAIHALTPHASGVLVDRQFAWERTVRERAVAPGCGLIAAADAFFAGPDEIVGSVAIDEEMVPERVRDQGAVAMKLLVLWRPDEPAEPRIAMVDAFVARCRRAGLVSIIEPVSRKPRDGRAWDWNAGVLEAARELGALGADLYKAEVPHHGEADDTTIRRDCAALTRAIASPWVVLSSGVQQNRFPSAVALACREGASGFLAGRAVWSGVIGRPDVEHALAEDAVPRLRALCDVVDRAIG